MSPPQLEMRVPFPASLGKDSLRSRRNSGGGTLNRKVERNSRSLATIPKDPQISQSTPDEPYFPALPRLPPRVSTHTTVACVTALWHLEGKPQIPVSTHRGAGYSCYCSGGKWMCLSPLQMRPEAPVETPEVPQDTCQDWRGNLRFRPQLQTRT